MGFSEILDQHYAVTILQRGLERDQLPHAFLFAGPEGVGKERTATTLAKALNCERGDNQGACDKCISCRKVDHGNHPDVILIKPTRKTMLIRVDDVEDMLSIAGLKPYEGRKKVFIIRDAHRMQEQAANKFLKTLEEPAGECLFILVTSHRESLLPTIRSRCQEVRFGVLQTDTVQKLLVERNGVSADRAAIVAPLAEGQMTRALELATSNKREQSIDLLKRLSGGLDPLTAGQEFESQLKEENEENERRLRHAIFADVGKVSREKREEIEEELAAAAEGAHRANILDRLGIFMSWYRDILVFKETGERDLLLNRDSAEEIAGEARSFTSMGLADNFRALETAKVQVERNVSEKRLFTLLFLELARSGI